MTRIRRVTDRVLAVTLVALMAVAVVNVLWQVFTRWVLADPSPYTEELARYLLIWIGLLGAAYAAGKKIHLAIDLLPSKLRGRRRHVLEMVNDGFILAFGFLVMGVGGYRLVSLTLLMDQRSAALGVPLGVVYLVIPLSGLLITYYAVDDVVQRARLMRGKEAAVVEPDRSTQRPID